ncbi:hypothetical protein ECEC4196_1736, partial [Escherichia coli EC4196]
MPSRQPDARF